MVYWQRRLRPSQIHDNGPDGECARAQAQAWKFQTANLPAASQPRRPTRSHLVQPRERPNPNSAFNHAWSEIALKRLRKAHLQHPHIAIKVQLWHNADARQSPVQIQPVRVLTDDHHQRQHEPIAYKAFQRSVLQACNRQQPTTISHFVEHFFVSVFLTVDLVYVHGLLDQLSRKLGERQGNRPNDPKASSPSAAAGACSCVHGRGSQRLNEDPGWDWKRIHELGPSANSSRPTVWRTQTQIEYQV